MEKAPSTKRPRYDAAFRGEALRLASESRSALAAARALNYAAGQRTEAQEATHRKDHLNWQSGCRARECIALRHRKEEKDLLQRYR